MATVKKTKKAQDGYTGKYETPAGTRFYRGQGPIATAMKIANLKARAGSADSVKAADLTDKEKKTLLPKSKDGGKWMQKAAASIKRRGTEGKCTPITKPGCTGRAKALAKTFKKIAKARKGK